MQEQLDQGVTRCLDRDRVPPCTRADDDPDYDDASKPFMRCLLNGLTATGLAPW